MRIMKPNGFLLLVLVVTTPGCSLFQKRDLTQDYASALRIYTGTATLVTDAITNGLVPKDKLPMVKAASDSAYQALKLMAAAVNAKDAGSFDSYYKVFSESVNLVNVILKGVKDAGGTTSGLGPDREQSPGIEGRGRGCIEVAGPARAGREPDAGAVADIGGGGNGREGGAGRGYCESLIDAFCGTAYGAEADGVTSPPAAGGSASLIEAILLLLNGITGVILVILNRKKNQAQDGKNEAIRIIMAAGRAVKYYAETDVPLPNASITSMIQDEATKANVEPKLKAILAGAGLLANK